MCQVRQILSQNVKYQDFLDKLFSSSMTQDEIKEELLLYHQAFESNYNFKIKQIQDRKQADLSKTKGRLDLSWHVNEVVRQNELENLFYECVEKVRLSLCIKAVQK